MASAGGACQERARQAWGAARRKVLAKDIQALARGGRVAPIARSRLPNAGRSVHGDERREDIVQPARR